MAERDPERRSGGQRRVAGTVVAGTLAVSAVLMLRHAVFPSAARALAADRPPAAGQPARPAPGPSAPAGLPGDGSPLPAAAPGSSATPRPVPAAPPPDPRVVRALATRICLQAGKASLWTELRRLGVGLTWPPAGEPHWTLDERIFDRGLRRLARRVDQPARNARLLHTVSGFRALPARPGRVLDPAAARRQLLAALARPGFRQSLESVPPARPAVLKLSFPLRTVSPTVTAAHLGAINTLLATYSTGLGGSSGNRRHNIRIACMAIDGTVLQPGEVFSYNQTVGPRTERAGFRTAPVIIHGELVPGTGGGVCQVSTTLYNVALLGDLKIVRRTHHHFPVHYAPPGRDATVAYGSLDLRFANSLPGPVALDVKTVGSRVVVRLYGTAACRRDVRLVTHRVSRAHPREAAGGAPGGVKRVVVTRVVRLENGGERHEVISHDTYAPPPARASGSHHARGRRPRFPGRKAPRPSRETPPAAGPVVRVSQPAEGH